MAFATHCCIHQWLRLSCGSQAEELAAAAAAHQAELQQVEVAHSEAQDELVQHLQQLRGQNEGLQQKLSKALQQAGHTKAQQSLTDHRITQADNQLHEQCELASQQKQELGDQLSELELRYEQLQQSHQQQQQQIADERAQQQQKDHSAKALLQKERVDAKAQIELVKMEVEALHQMEVEAVQQDNAQLEQRVAELEQQECQLEQQADTLKLQALQSEEQVLRLGDENAQLASAGVSSSEQCHAELQAEVQQLTRRLAEQQSSVDAADEQRHLMVDKESQLQRLVNELEEQQVVQQGIYTLKAAEAAQQIQQLMSSMEQLSISTVSMQQSHEDKLQELNSQRAAAEQQLTEQLKEQLKERDESDCMQQLRAMVSVSTCDCVA